VGEGIGGEELTCWARRGRGRAGDAPEVQRLQRRAAREGAGQRDGAGVADGVRPAQEEKRKGGKWCGLVDGGKTTRGRLRGVTAVVGWSGERMGGGSEASFFFDASPME
jgi:hypothetical protein